MITEANDRGSGETCADFSDWRPHTGAAYGPVSDGGGAFGARGVEF